MSLKIRIIKRTCLVCGRNLKVTLTKGKPDKGGYYFGVMKLPVGKGKYKKIGYSKVLSPELGKVPIVKWTGKRKEIEYWECWYCFHGWTDLHWKIKRFFCEKIFRMTYCMDCEKHNYNCVHKSVRK